MKGKKKGKKKDEGKAPVVDPEAEEEDETQFQMALLEIRVKELETLNLGLKKKCDYLESQNNVYKEQLEETRDEKNDLVTHLKRGLEEERTNVKELEDRLFGVQEAWSDDKKEYERKLSKKDEELNEMKNGLDKQILELNAKLTSLEEFRMQKDKLTAETAELRRNLIQERKGFAQKFEELENRMIRSREKMKNDATDIITQMAKDIQKAGQLSLTATVKNAIQENISLREQIELCGEESVKLREDYQRMAEKLRKARMTVQVLEDENALVHRKSLQFRKMISELSERQMVMDVRIRTLDEVESELEKVKVEHAKCKAAPDMDKFRQVFIGRAMKRLGQPGELEALQKKIVSFQDLIIQLAIAAKDVTEASNDEELTYLRTRFWNAVLRLYGTACELPELPPEIKQRLVVNVPKITADTKR